MFKSSDDSLAEFRRFLKHSIDEIDALDDMPDSLPDGEAQLRRYARVAGEAGLQALHAGFADLHNQSLQMCEFVERTTALTFLADCLAKCRETAAAKPLVAVSRSQAMMTADEVAEYLGITVRSVRRRVLDGSLPQPLKIGRSVRFQRKDIEAVASGK